MSDGQNGIACLDILTKCIELIELQDYIASICLLLSKKTFFESKLSQTGSIALSRNVHLCPLLFK